VNQTFRLPPLLHAAPIAIAALDLEGRILDANQALLDASGYALEDLRGIAFTRFVAPGSGAADAGHFAALVRGAIDTYRVERRYIARDGGARDADLSVSLVRDASGAPDVCLAVLHDVAERKRTEAALRLSEARYRALVEQAPLSIQILSPDGTTLQVNAAWERLWGATLEQIANYNLLEDPQLESLGLLSIIRRAFAGEAVVIPAARYDPAETLPDLAEAGHSRWVRAVMYPLKTDDGRVSEVVLIHEDITDRTVADEQRREATERLQLVIQQSGEAVVVADAEGVIHIFNPAAERLYGVADALVPADRWTEHYRLRRMDGTPLPYEETALHRAVRGQLVRDFRWQVQLDDGTRRQLSGTAAPLRSADGRPAGAVLIARDETERLAAEQERERLLEDMRRAHEQVEAASRVKDEFLATLSHELRTPLNAVLGWARILRTRLTDTEAMRSLEVIERNALAQARLVDDLLDMSRIVTGTIALQVAAVDLAQVAAVAVETVRPAAEARGVGLTLDTPAGLPAVMGDAQRLQQVLWNLLSNAVKFNEPGGHVEVTLASDRQAVVATVRDTGIGIPASILPYVFDRFTQADASTTRAHTGIGLGLAIARHLVELHGGTVAAESDGPGRGATFRVWIPVRSEGPPDPHGTWKTPHTSRRA
jgi:PAS domain S-box-containing protein